MSSPIGPGVVRVVLAAIAAALLLPAAAAGAATPSPGVPACAIGTLSGAARTGVPALLTRERRAYEAKAGGSAATRAAAGKDFAAGLAAYLYGSPEVLLRRTVQRFPLNQLLSIATLTEPSTRTVVAPNHDTLYTVSRLDLTAGPLVFDLPPTGGRYAVLQLLDQFTNSFDYPGRGTERSRGGTVLLAPPGWTGVVPPGARLVRSPSKLVWVLGRTLVDGADDLPAATALLRRYSMTPLASWLTGTRTAPLILPSFPKQLQPVTLPTGLAFFDALGADLAADAAPKADACALRAFARAGIGPGRTPSEDATATQRRALRAAATAGPRVVSELVAADRRAQPDGWTAGPKDIGDFGRDYTGRAAVARFGLGANTAREALYPNTGEDSAGRPLTGANVYKLRFAPGELPPVRSFWSLTLYDSARYLVPNSAERYALGDRTPGLEKDADGGLTVWAARTRPSGVPAANWLPAPGGRFYLYLRLYEPAARAASGTWRPPAVQRVR